MDSCMKEKNNKYYNQFLPKYDLLLTLNYNYTKKQESAIKILETYIDKINIDTVSQLDIYLL